MPTDGVVRPLSACSDEAFSQEIMGLGFLVASDGGEVISLVDGTIGMLYKILRAAGIRMEDESETLFYVEIDAVEFGGLRCARERGIGRVEGGKALLSVGCSAIKKAGKSCETIILFPDKSTSSVRVHEDRRIKTGEGHTRGRHGA